MANTEKVVNDNEKMWIVIGDIHDDLGNLDRIEEIGNAAGIIVSGDLTNCGGVLDARKVLEKLNDYGKPVLAQIGNMDLIEVDSLLTKKNMNLHRQCHELAAEAGIFGIGGSTPTPMNTPTEFPEAEYSAWLEEEWEAVKKYPVTVLISHNPPKDTACDTIGDNIHVGSVAVREFIEKKQPDICICGHIHEAKGTDRIGRTVIINPGTLAEGGYAKLILKDGVMEGVLCQVK